MPFLGTPPTGFQQWPTLSGGGGGGGDGGSTPPVSGSLIWSEEFDVYPSVVSNASGGAGDVTSNWRHNFPYQNADKGFRDLAGTNWNVNPNDPAYAGYSPFSVAGSVLTIKSFRTPPALVSQIRADLISGGQGGLPDPAWCGGYLVTNSAKRKFTRPCYVEWRARWSTPGKGMFPALWMYASDGSSDVQNKGGAEIDMLEINGIRDIWNTNLHLYQNNNTGSGGGTGGISDLAVGQQSQDTTNWHTYGLDWTSVYLRFYRDNVLIYEVTGLTASWYSTNMNILVNFGMDAPWFGGSSSDGTTPSPMIMEVDYVRVYSAKPVPFTGLRVSAGNILDPNGNVWKGRGIAITDEQVSSKGAALWTTVKGWFPNTKMIRIANYIMGTPASYAPFVTAATNDGVFIVFEHHLTGNPVLSSADLTAESNWYASMATYYINNAYVMYGTMNEPPTNDIAQMQATYNAVRNAGYNGILFLEAGLGANGDPATLGTGATATIGAMHNVAWDIHCYNWESGYSTNVATITADQNTRITNMKTVQSADGVMAVVCHEMGNSTDGTNVDAGGSQQVQASFNNTNFSAMIAWAWTNYTPTGNKNTEADNLSPSGNGTSLTAYGTQVATYLTGAAPGSVTFDAKATSDKTQHPSSTPQTLTTMTVGAGANLLTATTHIGGSTNPPPACTGVTWNGVAMTEIGHAVAPDGLSAVYEFGLLNPAVGNFNLVATYASGITAEDTYLDCASWKGADVSSFANCFPSAGILTSSQVATAGSGFPSAKFTETTVSGDMVVAAMNNLIAAWSVTSPATTLRTDSVNNGNCCWGYQPATSTSTQISFSGGTGNCCGVAFRIKAA